MGKEKIDFGIVILHYLNIDDTYETVQSFKERLDTDNYRLVIVDNASPDGSGKILMEKYQADEKVVVILNEKNLGFSAGNNIGIEYMHQNYSFEFLVLSNNDIYLYEENFYKKVKQEYEISQFAVMGPLIMTVEGKCDANPISDKPYSKEDSLAEIAQYKKWIKLGEKGLYPLYARYDYYMKKFFSSYRNRHTGVIQKDRSNGLFLKKRDSIVLHGCFLIFSQTYFEKFRGLDERTFMYSEENILYWHLKALGMNMLYFPEIAIYHKEGASVNKAFKDNENAKMFRYKMKIEAHQSYIKLMDEFANGETKYCYLGEYIKCKALF